LALVDIVVHSIFSLGDLSRYPGATNPVVKNGSDKYIYGMVECGKTPYNTTNVSCYVPTLVRDVKSGM
jgi:hypothetical protein